MTDVVDVAEAVSEVAPVLADGAHLFWETPFSEYTVNEGLLLLIFLAGFLWLIIWFFRGGGF